jgi:hypothetical protein
MGCWAAAEAAAEADMCKAGVGRTKEDLADEFPAAVMAMSDGVSPVMLAAAAAAMAWESLDRRGDFEEEVAECCLEGYTALMLLTLDATACKTS